MNVEISQTEYLKLLLETDEKHQDLYWCLRTKLQLKKMQTISGYKLIEQLEKVDLKLHEITPKYLPNKDFGKQVIK